MAWVETLPMLCAQKIDVCHERVVRLAGSGWVHCGSGNVRALFRAFECSFRPDARNVKITLILNGVQICTHDNMTKEGLRGHSRLDGYPQSGNAGQATQPLESPRRPLTLYIIV